MPSWGFHTHTYMCTHPHEPVQTTHVQEKMGGGGGAQGGGGGRRREEGENKADDQGYFHSLNTFLMILGMKATVAPCAPRCIAE